MKLHQIRYLVATDAHGSIRAAARALGLSPATVTQGLRELETDCGLSLFDRGSGAATLTAAGRDLLAHAQRIVQQLQQAEAELALHRQRGAVERLSLGVTPWVAQALLAPVLVAFRAAMPQVQLELIDGFSALAYPRLRSGELSMMIGRIGTPEEMAGLQATPLFSYEAIVAGRRGHPHAGARSIHELLDCDWLLNFDPAGEASLMHQIFGAHGAAVPRGRIHLAHSASLMLTLVRETDMLTFCPWPLLETGRLRGELTALPLAERFETRTMGVIRRAHEAPGLAAQRFLTLFMDEIRRGMADPDPALRRVYYSVDLLA